MVKAYESHVNVEVAGEDASHATVAMVVLLVLSSSKRLSDGDISFFSSSSEKDSTLVDSIMLCEQD